VISPDGLVLTNYHVVCESERVRLVRTSDKNGRWYDDTGIIIIGYDKDADIALIKVKSVRNWAYVDIAGDYTLTAGQEVFTVGNPQGEHQVVTQGVVYDTEWTTGGRNVIRCDIEIAPGSSGGALYNGNGELVGIARLGNILIENGKKSLNGFVPLKYYDEIKEQNKNITVAEFKAESDVMSTPRELVDMLGDEYVGKVRDGFTGYVRVDSVAAGIDPDDEDELYVYVSIDYNQYIHYLRGIKAKKDSIIKITEELLFEILAKSKEGFASKTIRLFYGVMEYTDTVPEGFEEYATYSSTIGKWLLWYPIVSIVSFPGEQEGIVVWRSIMSE